MQKNSLEFGEGQRHGVLEAVEDVDFLLASEDELDGMPVLLKLEESLAAHAAGGSGFFNKLATGERSDGYGFDRHTGEIGTRRVECGTLSTDTCESRILLICTDKDLSVIKHQSGADPEVTVW